MIVEVTETKIVRREITDAEFNLVWDIYNDPYPMKIKIIKFMRVQYSLGLKDAKDLCDTIGALRKPT